jgi:hypothetical protein
MANLTSSVFEDVQGSKPVQPKHAMKWIATPFSSGFRGCIMKQAANVQAAADLIFLCKELAPSAEDGWQPQWSLGSMAVVVAPLN